jgi:hypothetical protein
VNVKFRKLGIKVLKAKVHAQLLGVFAQNQARLAPLGWAGRLNQ